MIIDVRKLKMTGKENYDFSFEYNPDNSIITLPDAKFEDSVKITGTLTLGGNDVFVNGKIEYNILGVCSRCLESANFHNIVEFDEEFSDSNEETEAYHYSKGLVDLTKMVNDKIILSIPYTIYCKDDCKGLCPVCGANLNKTDCNCQK